MLESAKVVGSMLKIYVTGSRTRKEYGYGNTKHGVKESRAEIYKTMQLLTRRMIKGAGMELEVIGRENLPTEGPVLYMASHKSIFDIVTLASIIDDPCIFIGKKEVSKMPLINIWFEALGCIYIDREDKRQSLESIMRGIKELKEGQSVVIFPEGTRTPGDEIKEFKAGSFKLATKTGVPIVPIALHNTYKVFEENKRVKRTKVTVNIGKPIETKGIDKEAEKSLPKKVEGIVRDLMQEILDRK